MNQKILKVTENIPLTSNVYKMVLKGDVSEVTRPGQFINIKLDGFYLRRPISVCDKVDDTLTIIYKVVGEGTEYMATLSEGAELDVLIGLGNGFDVNASGDTALLLGGGVGVPPLYMLCKKLIEAGKKVTVCLGFNTADEVFYENEFKALGALVRVATVDGSYGTKGFVTNLFEDVDYSYYYTCGPEPMLKAVFNTCTSDGELSFEERMGCGFGACMCCSCKTVTGYKRICKEGPVMKKEEIIWNA
ncbi:MAG: dihydroorotate dehydrogenase electron transfer subunit [Ruminococcus sp.]|nr:dihydroorotate dehydrogenase electron transfer subunit [Ruminococcus sp.]